MGVQISRPTEVYEHIGKAYGHAAIYSDLIKLCDKDLADLGIELEQMAEALNQKQRECMICLDSLQRTYGDQGESQEAERQRRYYLEKIEVCKRKRNRLSVISEEYRVLIKESRKLQQDAANVAERLKQPAMSVRKVIEKYLASL